MKRLLIILSICTLSYGSISAQAIKVNPFSYLGGSNLVGIEFPVGQAASIQVNLNYGGFKKDGNKYYSPGAGLEFRYYFGEQMNAFYVAPAISFSSGIANMKDTATSAISDIRFTSFGGDLRGGRQWIFNSGFLLDLNLTVGYGVYSYKYDNSDLENYFRNLVYDGGLRYGVTLGLGYAFGSKKKSHAGDAVEGASEAVE